MEELPETYGCHHRHRHCISNCFACLGLPLIIFNVTQWKSLQCAPLRCHNLWVSRLPMISQWKAMERWTISRQTLTSLETNPWVPHCPIAWGSVIRHKYELALQRFLAQLGRYRHFPRPEVSPLDLTIASSQVASSWRTQWFRNVIETNVLALPWAYRTRVTPHMWWRCGLPSSDINSLPALRQAEVLAIVYTMISNPVCWKIFTQELQNSVQWNLPVLLLRAESLNILENEK